jgi:Tol biopolymer transport system component
MPGYERGDDGRRRFLTWPDNYGGTWFLEQPSFSPDGKKIAFCRIAGSVLYGDLAVYDLMTKEKKVIAEDYVKWPEWSPDGTWIAYDDRRDKDSVWLVRPDGSDRSALTPPDISRYGPRWSPDGKRIYFTEEVRRGPLRISYYDFDTVKIEPLWSSENYNCRVVVPSPGGEKIAMALFEPAENPALPDIILATVNTDGTVFQRHWVGESSEAVGWPVDWSPDGKYVLVLYANEYTWALELFAYELKTGRIVQVTTCPEGMATETIAHAAWGPDGTIYFYER